jgi:hypothetical protein
VKDEKAVMDITTSSKLAVVHFFKPDFGRCGVMDGHLEVCIDAVLTLPEESGWTDDSQILAPKHFDTRFIKINVDNAPFLVTKLKVQVLPCVIAFVNGIGQDRIIGFEGLGDGHSFATIDLEARLLHTGVLTRAKVGEDETFRHASAKKEDEEYDDDDWD